MSLAWRSLVKQALLPLASLILGPFPEGAQAQQAAITRFRGKAVTPIIVSDRSGKRVSLFDLKGRIVIVNMWATWCAPCRAEMPTLERLAARYPKDLVVLAVSNDSDGWPAVDAFWKSQFPHLRSALAQGPELAGRMGALGLPYSVIVDRDGREIARVTRGTEWDKGELAVLIARSVTQTRKA